MHMVERTGMGIRKIGTGTCVVHGKIDAGPFKLEEPEPMKVTIG